MLTHFISFIGSILLLRYLQDLFYTIYILFFSKRIYLPKKYGENSYVIVTGGSKGIGFGLACEFAKQGFNLVIIARNKNDLQNAKEELTTINTKIDVITRSFDFNSLTNYSSDLDMWKLLDLSRDLDYSILVNNVGMSSTISLNEMDEEAIKKMITVNCTSQALMTAMMIEYFKKRSRLSCVVTVSSIANKYPFAGIELYGATKKLNQHLAFSLCEHEQIDNYIYSPGVVDTDMTKHIRDPLKVSVSEAAGSAVKFIGRSRVEFYGHYKHELICRVIRLLPGFVLGRIKAQ